MITILVSINDRFIFNELESTCSSDIEVVETKNFDGLGDIIQAIVAVSSITIPLIYKIIKSHISSKKYISVKYKGVEIKGVSEKNIVEILNKINNND